MKSLLSRLRFAIAALALLCSVSAVAHDYAMADSAVVDTISAPHAKWYRQLIDTPTSITRDSGDGVWMSTIGATAPSTAMTPITLWVPGKTGRRD